MVIHRPVYVMSSCFLQMFSCQIAIRPSCWFDDAGNVTWTILCSTYVTSQSLNDLYTGVGRSATNRPLPLVGSPCHCDNPLWYGAYRCMGPRALKPGRWVTALNASWMNSISTIAAGHLVHDDFVTWNRFPYYCPLWGESMSHQWLPPTKGKNTELWWFLILSLNTLLNE